MASRSFVPTSDTQLIAFLDKMELEGRKWLAKWTSTWRADVENARGEVGLQINQGT